MEIIEDNMDIALDIINVLMQNKEIKKAENPTLYQSYVNNGEIENLTNKIAKKMKIHLIFFSFYGRILYWRSP